MRPSTLLPFLGVASARIIGFAAPSTIAPNSNVTLQIVAENYIQAVDDIAFSFGLAIANQSYPGAVGHLLSSKFLGPENSNIIGNITHEVHIPVDVVPGVEYVLAGAHFSLIGAVDSPWIENYAINVTIGEVTGTEYVMSELVESP